MGRRRGLLGLAAVAATAALAAACGSGQPGSLLPASPPITRVGDAQGFSLHVTLPASTFAAGEVIPISTTVTWNGPADSARIFGSGMGPVAFLVAEVGGAGRTMGGVMTADCAVKAYSRGVPVAIPLQKSGAYQENDPQAEFYRAWNADPALRLPAGRWQVAVSLSGYLLPCDQDAPALEIKLAPIDLLVQ